MLHVSGLESTSVPDSSPIFERLNDALSDVVLRNRNLNRDIAHAVDLSASQIAVLATLGRLGESRIADLADELWVDPSVVSRHLAALERTGYVARRPDPDDGRAALVRLSSDGGSIRILVRRRRCERLEAALADFSAPQIENIAEALRAIGGALDALGEPTSTRVDA